MEQLWKEMTQPIDDPQRREEYHTLMKRARKNWKRVLRMRRQGASESDVKTKASDVYGALVEAYALCPRTHTSMSCQVTCVIL